jgi:hypothetical protein
LGNDLCRETRCPQRGYDLVAERYIAPADAHCQRIAVIGTTMDGDDLMGLTYERKSLRFVEPRRRDV